MGDGIKRAIFLLLFVVGCVLTSNAQKLADDSIKPQKDSVDIYQNIYEFSRNNNFNKFLYDLIFRKPKKNSSQPPPKSPRKEYNYADAEGKIIRNIVVITRDPFTVDDSDEGFFSQKTLDNVGNFLHTNTQPFIIKNLLLFKENQLFDSLSVQESERLVRSQRYIDRSAIRGFQVENTDSVDVYVVVKDKFTISGEGDMSTSRFGLGLTEKNLGGLGHQAHVYYAWNYSGGVHDYQYDYRIPNIMNTYINSAFIYKKNLADTNRTTQFYAERPFYSSLTKWAGGIDIKQEVRKYNVFNAENEQIRQGFKYNITDVWGAYAFKMRSRSALRQRTQKLIVSGRYYNINFVESPDPEFDPLNIYSKEHLYLIGVGISERTYREDQYLFRQGFTEDVPVGYTNSLIAGFQRKNRESRLYLGTKWSAGKYLKKIGYASGTFEFGTFFDGFDLKEGVLTAEINYFSPLFNINGFKIRQFIKPQYMLGINRLETDRLSLEDYFGISGFNNQSITGTQKFVCNFQTQTFLPWKLWGFSCGPYFIYSMGMLGDQEYGFRKSKVYSMFGLGFLIRNDNLVFNTFQISISFYPHIPENGRNIFKFNTYNAADFGMRDFDIKKPDKVIYK